MTGHPPSLRRDADTRSSPRPVFRSFASRQCTQSAETSIEASLSAIARGATSSMLCRRSALKRLAKCLRQMPANADCEAGGVPSSSFSGHEVEAEVPDRRRVIEKSSFVSFLSAACYASLAAATRLFSRSRLIMGRFSLQDPRSIAVEDASSKSSAFILWNLFKQRRNHREYA